MNLQNIFFLLAISAGLVWGTAREVHADSNPSSATLPGLLGNSARADSMGSVFVGIADDGSALFFNAAGLGGLQRARIVLNHNAYLAGVSQETLLYSFPAGPLGGVGLALQYVNWGNVDGRDSSGAPQGSFSDNDMGLSAGWGWPLSKSLSAGVALHVFQEKAGDSTYTGISGDAGLLYQPPDGWRLGLSYTGLGTPIAGYAPLEGFNAGASRLFPLVKDVNLLAALSGIYESGNESRLRAGVEAEINKNWFIRAGYQLPLSDNPYGGGISNLTAGAGIKFQGFSLDYAYVPYGDLGTSNRLSLGYEFPNPPAVPVMAKPQPLPTQAPKSPLKVKFELPADAAATTATGSPENPDLTQALAAVQTHPEDSRVWEDLGKAYLKAGRKDSATQCFEQALRLKPGDKEINDLLEKSKKL